MNSQRSLLAAAIAATLAASTSLQAATMDKSRDFPQRLYLGGSLGISSLKPDTRDTGYHRDDDSGTSAALTLGLDIGKHLSVEGFYGRLGEAGIAEDVSNRHAGEIDYEYGGVSAIGYLYNNRGNADYPGYPDDEGYYRREGLSLYGRIGTGKLDTSSGDVVHRQRKSWDLHLGAGVEYGWSNGFAARLEFISFDEDAKIVSMGLIKRFGPSHQPLLPPVPKAPAPAATIMPPLTPPPPPPPQVEKNVTMPPIHFGFDRHDLTPAAREKLDDVAATLQQRKTLKLRLDGHTDSIGSRAYNQKLGQKRADSAAQYLIGKGVAAQRLRTISFGEERPIADNATAEGRRLNRRVEFEFE